MEEPRTKFNKLKKNILERIEREAITPASRLTYILQNSAFWSLWVLSVIFGALAVSVLIFTELNVGWEFYELTHNNALTFFVNSLPYVWVGLLGLVIVLGYYNLRHTKRGYRYSITLIILIGVFGSFAGGVLLHAYRVGEFTDRVIGSRLPLHVPPQHLREVFWSQPNEGRYSGIVQSLDSQNQILTVLTNDGKTAVFTLKFIPQDVQSILTPNAHVRIIATTSSAYAQMVACHLALWQQQVAHTLADLEQRRESIANEFTHFEPDGDETHNPCNGLVPPAPSSTQIFPLK